MRLGQGGLDDVRRGRSSSHSPAGHCVGLGHAVEDDGLVREGSGTSLTMCAVCAFSYSRCS